MATIQVRVDDALKQQADALFSDLGLDTSSAIRVFLKQSVSYGGIPFELRADSWREYVARALREADTEARTTAERVTREELMGEVRARINGI